MRSSGKIWTSEPYLLKYTGNKKTVFQDGRDGDDLFILVDGCRHEVKQKVWYSYRGVPIKVESPQEAFMREGERFALMALK